VPLFREQGKIFLIITFDVKKINILFIKVFPSECCNFLMCKGKDHPITGHEGPEGE